MSDDDITHISSRRTPPSDDETRVSARRGGASSAGEPAADSPPEFTESDLATQAEQQQHGVTPSLEALPPGVEPREVTRGSFGTIERPLSPRDIPASAPADEEHEPAGSAGWTVDRVLTPEQARHRRETRRHRRLASVWMVAAAAGLAALLAIAGIAVLIATA